MLIHTEEATLTHDKRLILTSAPSFQSRGFLAWRDWSPTSASEKMEWKKRGQRCQPGTKVCYYSRHTVDSMLYDSGPIWHSRHKITLKSFISQLKVAFVWKKLCRGCQLWACREEKNNDGFLMWDLGGIYSPTIPECHPAAQTCESWWFHPAHSLQGGGSLELWRRDSTVQDGDRLMKQSADRLDKLPSHLRSLSQTSMHQKTYPSLVTEVVNEWGWKQKFLFLFSMNKVDSECTEAKKGRFFYMNMWMVCPWAW